MKQGDFEQAESLIVQAEKLDAKYDALTERFVDTPAKLRKLLAEERVAGRQPAAACRRSPPGRRSPAIPSQLPQVVNPQRRTRWQRMPPSG